MTLVFKFIMAGKALKQWALTDNETITSFESWRNNMTYILALEDKFRTFLLPDMTWTKASKANRYRGFTGLNAPNQCATLELMLGQIANFAPIITRNTIVKNSTKLQDIWDSIRLYYGIQSNGSRFLDIMDIKYCEGKRYEALYQELMAFIEDNLLTADSIIKHHGESIAEEEYVSPSLENLVVVMWLHMINPMLLKEVKERFATELRCNTIASLRREISQALDGMLSKVNESARVMYTNTKSHPKTSTKVCPICQAAGKPYGHFLSQCRYLPEPDKRFLSSRRGKTRKITVEVPLDDSDSDDEQGYHPPEEDNQDPTNRLIVIRRVNTKKSPHFNAFYRQHPLSCLQNYFKII